MDKHKFEEFKKKYWPKTKKELEKGMEQTKVLLKKGEEHVREFSHQSAVQAKKMHLQLKREKLFYDLGKAVATTPKTRWNTTEKIAKAVTNIKDLSKEIKSIK